MDKNEIRRAQVARAEADWWDGFFEGNAARLWLEAMTPETTAREADVLERLLAIEAGAEVLDVPCGGGRLSLALAARGYRLTGVDLSDAFLEHAAAADGAERVAWERRDMRDLPWPGRFNGVFCVGNSFGYLDDTGNEAFLDAVWAALAPGGRFVLETPMVIENLLGSIGDRPWWKVGDMYLLVANEYDHRRSRLEIEYTFVADGRIEVRRGSHRAYRYAELRTLIERRGFSVVDAEPWRREARSVTFVATKPPHGRDAAAHF